jgi:mRNA-degrading endonuclease toxin of MazEF toxin-antitoxin module
MSDQAGASGTPTPPPAPFVRYADILFVDAVLDSAGRNPKGRRVVVLTPDDALAAGFPIVAAPVTTKIPPSPLARRG